MKEGYQKTKIGFIPTEWKITKVSKITKTCSGGTPSTSNINFWGGDIKWMNSGELNLKKIHEVEGRITELGLKNSSTKNIPSKSVLIGLAGQGKTRGTVAINYIELCVNQSIAAILPNESTIPEFLYYNLDNRYDELRKLSTGDGGRGGLNLSIINSLLIPLPPLKEQEAIANCLSTWDKAIEFQNELINSKESRKKVFTQQLLTGKRRLPGFSGEWKEESYGKLLTQIKRKENWDDSHLYHLISVRRRSGGIFHRDSLYGHQIAVKELMKVKKDDFLISKMQILHGASSSVKQKFENFFVSGSYIILNVRDPKKLSPDYLDFYSKQKIFYHQTYISSYGVHIEKMTFDFKTFLKMNMILPSIEEQNAIVKVLETADKELQLEKQKLADLQQQKKALMQQLLTGKVRLV